MVDPGNVMATQPQSDVNNNNSNLAPQVQIVGTQAVLRVGDRVFALPPLNTSYAMPSVVSPAIDAYQTQAPDPSKIPTRSGYPPASLQLPRSNTQSPFLNSDLPTLEAQWSAKKEELRSVEQTEVLQAEHQGPVWRNTMIAKKKSLILEIDTLRKQIAATKELSASKGNTIAGQATSLAVPPGSATAMSPSFLPQLQQPLPQGVYSNTGVPFGIPVPSAFASLMMYPGYNGLQPCPAEVPQFSNDASLLVPGETSLGGSQRPKPFTHGTNGAQSPGSASRRSHAVPIKKPQDETKKQGSTLDPKSPTYEPVSKTAREAENIKESVPPTPSPGKRSPWHTNEVGSAQSDKHKENAISQQPSLSSIDTTDFFPTNTHEYSSTRVAPNKMSKQSSHESMAGPSTPGKRWSVGPWNPPSNGPSNRVTLTTQNDPTKRLTSWPEAFGKQSPLAGSTNKIAGECGASSATQRNSSAQYTGTDLNWPPIASEPTSYVPSTYQEGYQAGLHHIGLPDDVAVLNGFIDGIVTFLKDKSSKTKKDRDTRSACLGGQLDLNDISARSSLRGYLPGGTLHDSAISLMENARSAKLNHMPSATYRQSGYSPKEDIPEQAVVYTLCNETAQEPCSRGQALQTPMSKDAYPTSSSIGNGQTRDNQAQSDYVQTTSAFGRQFSGNQIGNRQYANPISMQRYFPSPKEYVPGLPSADIYQSTRPAPRQRLSGLDGAVDELAGLVVERQTDEKSPKESTDVDASCFKASSGKGKQKAPSSPIKSIGKDASSPVKDTGSPKKSGEVSPAKAKLEQVTNKLRRPRKDDPRTMSPEEKQKRTEKWRGRFRGIRAREADEIHKYISENPRRDSGEHRRR